MAERTDINPDIVGGQINKNHRHNGNDSQKVFMKDLLPLTVNALPMLGLDLAPGSNGELRLYFNTVDLPVGYGGLWLLCYYNNQWNAVKFNDFLPF